MRSVIREPEFEQSLREIFFDPKEADDYTEAAEILLAHDPSVGTSGFIGGGIRSLPMPPVDGQTIVLYYTFDESTVWLLFLRAF